MYLGTEHADQPADGHRDQQAKKLSLRDNFSWTLAGNVVYSACQWGMVVLLARIAGPQVLGRLAFALALSAPVFMLAGLQLRAVQATDSKREYLFGHYLALRIATTLVALIAAVFIAGLLRRGADVVVVICAVAVSKALESMSDVFYGLLQQHERMDRIGMSMIVRGTASLVVFAATMLWTRSLPWSIAAMSAVWALVLAVYDARSGRIALASTPEETLRPVCDLRVLWKLGVVAFPLGIVMMLVSLNTNIPRYAIEQRLGESNLGVFAALAALLVAGNTVVGALGQSASPRLAKHFAAADLSAFRGLLAKLLATGAVVGLVGLAAALLGGRWLLGAVYGHQFAGHTALFAWITAAAGISYLQSITGYGVTAARYFAVQAPLLAIVSGATAVGCLWLVPRFGLVGAGIALVFAGLMHLAGNLVILAHALSRQQAVQPALAVEEA